MFFTCFEERKKMSALMTRQLEATNTNCVMKERIAHGASRIMQMVEGEDEKFSYTLRGEQENVFKSFSGYLTLVASSADTLTEPPMARIVQPPRTGKTVVAGACISGSGMMTTFIVPTMILVEQTAIELRAQMPDVPIGTFYSQKKNLVLFGVNITTYSMLQAYWRNHGYLPPEIALSSLIFCDEGHRAMTQKRLEVLKEGFDPLAVRVALTATPNYDEKRMLSKYFPVLIHEITLMEAVELDLLAGMRFWLAEVDVDGSVVEVVNGDYREDVLGDLMTEAPFFEATRIFRYDSNNRHKGALICCTTIAQAEELYAYLCEKRPKSHPKPEIITGKTTELDRKIILEAFERGMIDTLINVGVLIEGWNSLRCKLLIDLAPTLSRVRAMQKFFRPMTKDGDEQAHVIMIMPRDLNRIPRMPLEFFGWEEEYQAGELLGATYDDREGSTLRVPLLRDKTSIKDVQVHQKIVMTYGGFKIPDLDPSATADIRNVLESSEQFSTDKLPTLKEFSWIVYSHPLFTGRGGHLLRYLGVKTSRHEYAAFMAQFYPEAASDLYFSTCLASQSESRYWERIALSQEQEIEDFLEYFMAEVEKKYQLERERAQALDSLKRKTHHTKAEEKEISRLMRLVDSAQDSQKGLYKRARSVLNHLALVDEHSNKTPFDEVCNTILTAKFRRVLATLSVQEERVIRLRFGIGHKSDHTLQEVGKKYDVSRERIRQIEAKALRKLRHPSRSHLLKHFI